MLLFDMYVVLHVNYNFFFEGLYRGLINPENVVMFMECYSIRLEVVLVIICQNL